MDFLDDLFAELQDGSPVSTDSGHGSPLSCESSLTNSPEQLAWDSDMNNDFWGSILDDLPADLSSNESDSNDQWNLNDQPLNWNNSFEKFPEDDSSLFNSSNFSTIDEDFLQDKPMISMNDLLVKEEENTASSVTNLYKEEKKVIASPQQLPIVLKPISVIKGVNKTGDIRSHIKIGNNIFAIIQKNDNTTTLQSITSTVPATKTVPVEKSSSIITPNEIEMPKIESKSSKTHATLDEHDYADEEDIDMLGTSGVSKGFGPGIMLTDEEKKLLDLENILIPEDAPLTKDEEKSLKKVRRKIKNKQSAMESRRRRKQYIDNLERRVKHCTDANHGLKRKVDKLTEDNKNLLVQLKQLQAVVKNSSQSNKTGTCLAVLLLSFALFYLPFNPMHVKNAGKPDVSSNTHTSAPVFRSRALLSIDDPKEYDYHDNESLIIGVHRNSEFEIANDSLIHETHEMRERLEKLLISEEHDLASPKLKDILSNYENTIRNNGMTGINIVEVREEYLQTPGTVSVNNDM